jgi:hypothetical protein
MVSHKCQIRLFWPHKTGQKQPFIKLHLHSTQSWFHQLTFCLPIQRAHMSACYATEWCLMAHSLSRAISIQSWNLSEFVRSAHQLIVTTASSNELPHSIC